MHVHTTFSQFIVYSLILKQNPKVVATILAKKLSVLKTILELLYIFTWSCFLYYFKVRVVLISDNYNFYLIVITPSCQNGFLIMLLSLFI